MIRNINDVLKFHPFFHFRTLILLFLSFFLISKTAMAANHYIRADAKGNGNGNDWENARTTMPSGKNSYIRGDTYYVADGSYSGFDIRCSSEGESYITIKKATIQDHGTATSWKDEYGDGSAHFHGSGNTITIRTGHLIIDGVTGSDDSGYGFKVTTSNCSGDSKLIKIEDGRDYITLSHIELEHCGADIGEYRQDIIYHNSSLNGGCDYLTISNCYLHDANRTWLLLNNVHYAMVEHCLFEKCGSSGAVHTAGHSWNYCGTSAHNTIRYNILRDSFGTAFIDIKDSVQAYFYIYGNIFYLSSLKSGEVHNAVITSTKRDTNTHMYVYNNTFVDFSDKGNFNTGVRWYCGDQFCSGNQAATNKTYNNLWYNCNNVNFDGTEHDYNAFSDDTAHGENHAQTSLNSSIFINYTGDNFQLAMPTNSGKIDIGAPYNIDMNGNIRGADGTWDMGAYEYNSGVSGDDDKPDPPTGLKIIIQD